MARAPSWTYVPRGRPGRKIVIKAGKAFRLRFGLLVHDHEAGRPFDREAAHAHYANGFR